MADNLEQLLKRALEGKISSMQRKEILGRCEGWSGCLIHGLLCAVAMVVWIAALLQVKQYLSARMFEYFALGSMLVVCLFATTPLYWRKRRTLLHVMAVLKKQGIRPHFCLHCRYDLKGSISDHCPECGTALAPADTTGND